MKKSIIFFTGILVSFSLCAQDPERISEIGLRFSNLNDYGVIYKTGNNQSLWRFKALYLDNNMENRKTDDYNRTQVSNAFGLGIGKEWRKPVAENLSIVYGADINASYRRSKLDYVDLLDETNDQTIVEGTLSAGISFVLGMNLQLGDHLMLGVAVLPGGSYSFYLPEDETDPESRSGLNLSLSTSNPVMTLAYRF